MIVLRLRRKRKGFTLLEILAVILIVIVLIGILVPVLTGAKVNAKKAYEISQLHNIGLAQSLYSQESGRVAPLDTLVRLGSVSKSDCLSPLDKTPEGIANALVKSEARGSSLYEKANLPYPSTYVGFREYQYPDDWYEKYVTVNPNSGWLVSFTSSSRRDLKTWLTIYSGKYRRLLFDTSVITREHELITAGGDAGQHPLLLFSDGSAQWKERLISTPP